MNTVPDNDPDPDADPDRDADPADPEQEPRVKDVLDAQHGTVRIIDVPDHFDKQDRRGRCSECGLHLRPDADEDPDINACGACRASSNSDNPQHASTDTGMESESETESGSQSESQSGGKHGRSR